VSFFPASSYPFLDRSPATRIARFRFETRTQRQRLVDGPGTLAHRATMTTTLPVTVITGFLGAGKTSLVNHWLALCEPGEIAVIVNELGVVGVDGELLAERARTVIELGGGCVCCKTQAELVDALYSIATSEALPRRVLVETSGAASPAGVVRAILGGGKSGTLVLDGMITVVNAAKIEKCLTHDLAREQLGYADVVVLSHSDVCSEPERTNAERIVAERNGAAMIVESARGRVTSASGAALDEVLALRHADSMWRVQPSFSVDHVYESVSLVHEGDVDGETFADFVETEVAKFAGRIFRIKGILAVAGIPARMIVQGVGEGVEVTFGSEWANAARQSRLVIVGYGLDSAALRRAFSEVCLSTEIN
jgi:G3E family GTPase